MKTSLLLPLILLPIMAASACRTALRAEPDSNVVSVDVRLVGLADSDKSRTDLVYTLTQCGAGSANGSKNPDQVATFLTKGVRKGDRCDVRVTSSKVDNTVEDWFDEPGLMYEARHALIVSSEGKLKALAVLQQLYTIPPPPSPPSAPTAWRLYAEVRSQKPLLELCTCSIGCTPALFNNVSKLETSGDKKSGVCLFANVVKPDLNRVECLQMIVQCGSDLYKGAWPAGNFIDGSRANDARLSALQLETAVPEDISDANIDIYVPH